MCISKIASLPPSGRLSTEGGRWNPSASRKRLEERNKAGKKPWVLIIDSTAGNGHHQVTQVLAKEINKRSPEVQVKVKDVMSDFLGGRGEQIKKQWRTAQKEGKIYQLKLMVKLQRLGDLFFHRPIKKALLKSLHDYEREFGCPPEYIINDQVSGLPAIFSALSEYNSELQKRGLKEVRCELHMTDLPEKADHFFNPIRRLSNKHKKLITLFSPAVKGMNKEQSSAFLQKKTGLHCEQITVLQDGQLPVDALYKDPKLKNISEFTFNDLERHGRQKYMQLLPNIAPYYNPAKQTYRVDPQDHVSAMMLGSQPTELDIEKAIKQMVALAHRASDKSKRYHFFAFCGEDEVGNPHTLFKRMCAKLRQMDVPPNLCVVPLPFQKPENIAKIRARSNVRIIRSGGISCFEDKELQKTLGSNNSKTYIWSENPQSELSLRYRHRHGGREPQKQLLKHIPLWERGNAKGMGCRIISSETFTQELSAEFYPANNKKVIKIKEGDEELLGKLSSLLYRPRCLLMRFWRWITGIDRREVIAITKQFNKAMDALEASGIAMAAKNGAKQDQGINFLHYLAYAKDLKRRLKQKAGSAAAQQSSLLKRRIVALKYRLEANNGGFNACRTADEVLLAKIEAVALNWKKNSLGHSDRPELTVRDRQQLCEAARHRQFVKILLKDKELQGEFNRWVLSQRLPTEVFIQYATADKALPLAMRDRIGRVCNDALRVETTAKGKKQLTMAFVEKSEEGTRRIVRHKVLKKQRTVPLTPHWQPTIGEIFAQIGGEDKRKQHVDLFNEGIENWSPALFARRDGRAASAPIDCRRSGWWEELPVFKTMTREEVEREYGAQTQNGQNWLLSARSNFQREQLEFDKNHSYVEMIIPQSDGKYHVYPFGRFSAKEPKKAMEKVNFAFNSVEGHILYPDHTACYSDRKNYGCTLALPEKVGREVMSKIGERIESSLAGELPFQLVNENCAKFVQEIVDFATQSVMSGKKIELFKANFLDSQPTGVAGALFRLPHCVKNFALRTFGSLMFRPDRSCQLGGKSYCVKNSPFWRDWTISHPTQLYKKLQRGELQPFYNFA